ncbi:hypothetical protein SK128_015712, partial [Halocaridina rubra]
MERLRLREGREEELLDHSVEVQPCSEEVGCIHSLNIITSLGRNLLGPLLKLVTL